MPEEQRIFPDPHDPGHIGRVIDELGGVDIAFGGIGINGAPRLQRAPAGAHL